MISAVVLDRKIVLPNVCPGLCPQWGWSPRFSVYLFLTLDFFCFLLFLPFILSNCLLSFLLLISYFLNALLKSSYKALANPGSLCCTCDPLWPWLCPDSLILQFFCLTFLWFSIFPSTHFLSSGFCHLCSTLNILAVFFDFLPPWSSDVFMLTCSLIGFSWGFFPSLGPGILSSVLCWLLSFSSLLFTQLCLGLVPFSPFCVWSPSPEEPQLSACQVHSRSAPVPCLVFLCRPTSVSLWTLSLRRFALKWTKCEQKPRPASKVWAEAAAATPGLCHSCHGAELPLSASHSSHRQILLP